jgi:hypothetical protein
MVSVWWCWLLSIECNKVIELCLNIGQQGHGCQSIPNVFDVFTRSVQKKFDKNIISTDQGFKVPHLHKNLIHQTHNYHIHLNTAKNCLITFYRIFNQLNYDYYSFCKQNPNLKKIKTWMTMCAAFPYFCIKKWQIELINKGLKLLTLSTYLFIMLNY